MRLTKPKVMQLHTLLMFTLAERETITYNQPHTRAEREREREREREMAAEHAGKTFEGHPMEGGDGVYSYANNSTYQVISYIYTYIYIRVKLPIHNKIKIIIP